MSDRNEPPPTAGQFADQLTAGIVPMRDVFALAKRCIDMDLDQIEELYQLPCGATTASTTGPLSTGRRRRWSATT